VLSFWYKGGMSALYVPVASSLGTRYVTYHSSSGTDFVSGTYVHVYLGSAAGGSTWRRFERDVRADFERVVGGGATWSNTDGILIRPDGNLGYDFYIDEIRLSNARTVEFNSLTGGAVGQIAAVRTVSGTGGNGSLGLTDSWLHYDHIGNVVNTSNSSGALAATSHQDAWGNVLASTTTGAWASSFSGRHLTTKEYDADGELYYFWQRWYTQSEGRFVSQDPQRAGGNYYTLAESNPLVNFDPSGLDWIRQGCKCNEVANRMREHTGSQGQLRDCVNRCESYCATYPNLPPNYGHFGALMSQCVQGCMRSKDCADALTGLAGCYATSLGNPDEIRKCIKKWGKKIRKYCF
jgi:RHS repeat-associated protein